MSNKTMPKAAYKKKSRNWVLLVPLLALAVSGWMLIHAYLERGTVIEIEFDQGYGLKPGDKMRHRGIVVGKVERILLRRDLERIRVFVRLRNDARELTREGSRFWVVRPQLTVGKAQGLETLVGANYLRVIPGGGDYSYRFQGLENPPIEDVVKPGGVQFVLMTDEANSLQSGSLITYREIPVGVITRVELSANRAFVEAHGYVEPAYRSLITEHTRFWHMGGAQVKAGLFSGISVNVESMQTLVLGGVGLAASPEPGHEVADGHRFTLADSPEKQWLEWVPALDQEEPEPVQNETPDPSSSD